MKPLMDIIDRCKKDPTVKIIAVLLAAWAALLVIGILLPGFARADTALLASLLLRVLLLAGLAAAALIYLRGDLAKGYRGFKAFTGYALFFSYVAGTLAGAAWYEGGYISLPLAWLSWLFGVLGCLPGLALYYLLSRNPMRQKLGVISKEELQKKLRYRPPKPRSLWGKVLDNVDAVVQAIIMVAVIHATLFQLYVIPSGSMIPKFLINDRVIVSKIQSGPRVPLSPLKLPTLSPPKRGDIIVFDNPFSEKPPVIRRMLNTLVFYLTLSNVNLDKETVNGMATDRVGTVVKRLVGMPGEKLMMLDDVLYRKTPSSAEWEAVKADAAWANANLYALPESLRRRMVSEALSFNAESRALCDSIDAWRKGRSLPEQAAALAAAAAPLGARGNSALLGSLSSAARAYVAEDESGSYAIFDREAASGSLAQVFARRALGSPRTWSSRDLYTQDMRLLLWALSDQSRSDALMEFLSAPAYGELNPYDTAAALLNLRAKELMAKRFAVYLSILRSGDVSRLARIALMDAEGFGPDTEILWDDWQGFKRYMAYFDFRAFPEFPRGAEYLGKDSFFLMGDNRYGSLDFRFMHGYVGDASKRVTVSEEYYDRADAEDRSLDAFDPRSVIYQSSMKPRTLSRDRILGKVLFTFWPPR